MYVVRIKSLNPFDIETEDGRDLYWKSFETQREKWYSITTKRVSKLFLKEADTIVETFERTGKLPEALVDEQKGEWKNLISAIYEDVATEFGQKVFDSLNKSANRHDFKAVYIPDVFYHALMEYLTTEALNKAVQICATTKTLLRKALDEGVALGEGIPKLAKRLQAAYDGMSKTRAVMIARTEVIGASNLGSHVAAQTTGLTLKKKWLATRDGRTRDDHAHADGQVQPLDDAFLVGGERLQFPGDSSGASAHNIINCRCTTTYSVVK